MLSCTGHRGTGWATGEQAPMYKDFPAEDSTPLLPHEEKGDAKEGRQELEPGKPDITYGSAT